MKNILYNNKPTYEMHTILYDIPCISFYLFSTKKRNMYRPITFSVLKKRLVAKTHFARLDKYKYSKTHSKEYYLK